MLRKLMATALSTEPALKKNLYSHRYFSFNRSGLMLSYEVVFI